MLLLVVKVVVMKKAKRDSKYVRTIDFVKYYLFSKPKIHTSSLQIHHFTLVKTAFWLNKHFQKANTKRQI